MEFELEEWKVGREAVGLTNQLFGSLSETEGKTFLNSQKSLKEKEHQSKKRKLDTQTVSHVNASDTNIREQKKKSRKSKKVSEKVEISQSKDVKLVNISDNQEFTKITKAGKKKKQKKTRVEGNAGLTESEGSNKTEDKDGKKVKIGKKRRLKEDEDGDTKSTNKKQKFNPKKKMLPPHEDVKISEAETTPSSASESKEKTKKRKRIKKGSNKRNKYKHLDDARRLEREKMGLENLSVDSGNIKDDGAKQVTLIIHGTDNNKVSVASSEPKKRTNSKQETLKEKKKKKPKQEKMIDIPKSEIDSKNEVSVKHVKRKSKDGVKNLSEDIAKSKNKLNSKSKNGQNANKKMNSPFNVGVLRNVLSAETDSAGNVKQTTDKNETVNSMNRDSMNKNVNKTEGSSTTENIKQLTLKEKMMNQLNSARFRYINEQLYTQTGQDARVMFESDQESYKIYHEGFHTQVQKWPTNPVDLIIRQISAGPKNHVIADFGCGDAKIARSVKQKVHSFDLVALNDHVTSCDMAHVPLSDKSVNIAVFCLSLMGTNLNEYLLEANRVLKSGGTLKVAEVTSRFSVTGIPRFIVNVEKFGFRAINTDTSNKMFVSLDFKKTGVPKATLPELSLHPCIYKRR